jgi:hypothetical protein
MTPMCPHCGSDRSKRSGRRLHKILRLLTLRSVYRCMDCMHRWRPGGRLPGNHHRSFLRRHKRMLAVVLLVIGLAGIYGLLSVLDMVPGGINYLKTEKLLTSDSGNEYTIGEAVEKTIKKSQEK